jgi:hypothetical protein
LRAADQLRQPRGMHFAPYTPEHRPFFVELFTDAGTMAHVGGPMTPEKAGLRLLQRFTDGDGDVLLYGIDLTAPAAPLR